MKYANLIIANARRMAKKFIRPDEANDGLNFLAKYAKLPRYDAQREIHRFLRDERHAVRWAAEKLLAH